MQVGQPLRKADASRRGKSELQRAGCPANSGGSRRARGGRRKVSQKTYHPPPVETPEAGKGCKGEVRAHRPGSNDGGTTNPTWSKTK
jgi:hypothetical protein